MTLGNFMMRTFKWSVAASLLLASASTADARTIEVPIHWSVQKNELSVARLRTIYGPKLRKDVCSKLGKAWLSGDTVKVTFYGASDVVITTFTYTERDCRKS
jgi:hypothetical protein